MVFCAMLKKALKDCNELTLTEAVNQFETAMVLKGHDCFKSVQQDFDRVVEDFGRQYGIEFNPTSGVISSVLSQEVIKVLTRRDHPAFGFMVYDSINQTFEIEQ